MTNVARHERRKFARQAWIRRVEGVVAIGVLATLGLPALPASAAPCDPPVLNPIVCENSKPGNPASEWDISGQGDANIEGFATDISVDQGQTVRFKVKTGASDYRLDLYRMGYYGGMGARKLATVQPSVTLPQSQPACLTSAGGPIDCGNWAESASWSVPGDAVSGIYFAKLVREDGVAGQNHIFFIVRDDDGGSDVLFQTSDTTWQAYNRWGGESLYVGTGGRAFKVSYNRPFITRGCCSRDFLFSTEYPMVRWLEANGYDVSYFTGVDSSRRGAEILEHRVFLSVGHDEYWSGEQRANVEAARNAGVSLAFFSGNEVFWKTRWENSIDGSATAYRTLVSYKETHANKKIDPDPSWTGTWRDPRFSPPADGGRPENALTGTMFTVNGPPSSAITVPAEFGVMRLWRNTSVASLPPGGVATFPVGTLGYEWDEDLDNGFRPAGLIRLSSTTVNVDRYLQNWGSNYSPGTAIHSLTLYRHPSGALVFGAGTIQWSWGLDATHDGNSPPPADLRMKQATVNLLGDMRVQPDTLQPGLVPASPSTDASAPTSAITAPAAGASVQSGNPVTVSGTAADSGGVVGGVEVSTDGGVTWHPAMGRQSWSYAWIPQAPGPTTILARAVDDSGNLQPTPTGRSVTVLPPACPCTMWGQQTTPTVTAANDSRATEVGVRFRALADGFISGVRFYKDSSNSGTHVGNLWTAAGALLATATFTNETASGWQKVSFANPVPVSSGTAYIASYFAPNGRYAQDSWYFATSGHQSWPLEGLMDMPKAGNGVFRYSASSAFPNTSSKSAANFWVDVVFESSVADTQPPSVTARAPATGATGVSPSANVTATFNESVQSGSLSFQLRDPSNALVPATVTYSDANRTVTLDPNSNLAATTAYTASVQATDLAGNAMSAPDVWSFTTGATGTTCPCSIWSAGASPGVASASDTRGVEIGVKFHTSVDGFITGVRFYKGPSNTGSHIGSLWTSSGALLATATFTNETASGWQQVSFGSSVPVTAGTTYIASYYAPVGGYAEDQSYFKTTGTVNGPLEALASGVDGPNGVFQYSATSTFPSTGSRATNYWVDVVFDP